MVAVAVQKAINNASASLPRDRSARLFFDGTEWRSFVGRRAVGTAAKVRGRDEPDTGIKFMLAFSQT